ncbi:helix-turn-helix domain-containing protein [Nocardia sp. CA-119907]|uniref:helix-turn-helix domain-containing protein n=1 Tax=Nocardia sp. CA-119907 TaxID=3239973 RepID=UPI003D968D0D
MTIANTPDRGDPQATAHDANARKAEFDDRIERWRDRLTNATLTDAQAEGFECVACGRNWLISPAVSSVPIGFGPKGQVFVCCPCDSQGSALDADAERFSRKVAKRVAADIRDRWLSRHRSLDTLAAELNLSTPALKKLITGEKPWNTAQLGILARLLGVSVFTWLGVDEEIERGVSK